MTPLAEAARPSARRRCPSPSATSARPRNDGAVRDSAALADLMLGIKALGTIPRKSGKNATGAIDVPVTFGGTTFHPGDLLHADDEGIVLTPATV